MTWSKLLQLLGMTHPVVCEETTTQRTGLRIAEDHEPPVCESHLEEIEALTLKLEEEETGSRPALLSDPAPGGSTTAIERLDILTRRMEIGGTG